MRDAYTNALKFASPFLRQTEAKSAQFRQGADTGARQRAQSPVTPQNYPLTPQRLHQAGFF